MALKSKSCHFVGNYKIIEWVELKLYAGIFQISCQILLYHTATLCMRRMKMQFINEAISSVQVFLKQKSWFFFHKLKRFCMFCSWIWKHKTAFTYKYDYWNSNNKSVWVHFIIVASSVEAKTFFRLLSFYIVHVEIRRFLITLCFKLVLIYFTEKIRTTNGS